MKKLKKYQAGGRMMLKALKSMTKGEKFKQSLKALSESEKFTVRAAKDAKATTGGHLKKALKKAQSYKKGDATPSVKDYVKANKQVKGFPTEKELNKYLDRHLKQPKKQDGGTIAEPSPPREIKETTNPIYPAPPREMHNPAYDYWNEQMKKQLEGAFRPSDLSRFEDTSPGSREVGPNPRHQRRSDKLFSKADSSFETGNTSKYKRQGRRAQRYSDRHGTDRPEAYTPRAYMMGGMTSAFRGDWVNGKKK